jgi:uncharacterized protein
MQIEFKTFIKPYTSVLYIYFKTRTVIFMDESACRQSSYNSIIPLSAAILKSDESLYIVCNPLSGNASILNNQEYKVLQAFPNTQEKSIVSQLKDEGYITDLTEKEEEKLMNIRYEEQKNPNDPRIAIIVTYQCNLRCTYCWTDHLFTSDRQSAVIDEKTVDAVFNTIPHIPAVAPARGISFYGGEPFLPPTFSIVQYILEKGSEKDFCFHANTNGYYLKEFVPLFTQYSMQGLGVTLDGCPSIHDARRKRRDGRGTFQNIVEGIDAALDAGIPIGVRINTDSENIDHLCSFRDWIEEHGWAATDITFAITPVLPGKENNPPGVLTYAEMARKILKMREESPSLFNVMHYTWEYGTEGYVSRTITSGTELKPRPFYCSAHNQLFSFDPFGDIYPCPRAVGDKTFSIGRFIPKLQFNSMYDQWFNRDVLSIPRCQKCDVALLCGGGCAYEAYLRDNTLYEGFCERYRAFLNYGAPFFVKHRIQAEENGTFNP